MSHRRSALYSRFEINLSQIVSHCGDPYTCCARAYLHLSDEECLTIMRCDKCDISLCLHNVDILS